MKFSTAERLNPLEINCSAIILVSGDTIKTPPVVASDFSSPQQIACKSNFYQIQWEASRTNFKSSLNKAYMASFVRSLTQFPTTSHKILHVSPYSTFQRRSCFCWIVMRDWRQQLLSKNWPMGIKRFLRNEKFQNGFEVCKSWSALVHRAQKDLINYSSICISFF